MLYLRKQLKQQLFSSSTLIKEIFQKITLNIFTMQITLCVHHKEMRDNNINIAGLLTYFEGQP